MDWLAANRFPSDAAPVPRPVLVALLLVPESLFAADTIEPFDKGLSDLEAYVHLEDAGSEESLIAGEVGLGFGMTDSLSMFAGAAWEAETQSGEGASGLGLTVFGTLLDTRHLDVDLYLGSSFALSEPFLSWELVPGMEINVDLEPDQSRAGAYYRVEWVVPGSLTPTGTGAVRADPGRLAYLLGAYVRFQGRHQVLVELPAGVSLEHRLAGAQVLPGEAVVGYNVLLREHVELITQVSVNWAASSPGALCGAAMVGAIVTR